MNKLNRTMLEVGTDILNGIGKNAEIETNKNGGSQSKAIGAMHLVDPCFLMDYLIDDEVIHNIAEFMRGKHRSFLLGAIGYLPFATKPEILFSISKVLQEGATKYGVNNWRLIPQEEHINHALLHYLAYLMNDKQDDHLEHCATRLMFAYATEKSKGFDYTHHASTLITQ